MTVHHAAPGGSLTLALGAYPEDLQTRLIGFRGKTPNGSIRGEHNAHYLASRTHRYRCFRLHRLQVEQEVMLKFIQELQVEQEVMFKFIQEHWDSITLVVSVVLNLLGVSGKIPPVGVPKGFAKLEDDHKSIYRDDH